jgi:hypothetical protein
MFDEPNVGRISLETYSRLDLSMHTLKRNSRKGTSKGLLRREGNPFLVLCGVGIVVANVGFI